MENQKFGIGDIALLEGYRVKVLSCTLDDGVWWYEVEAIDLDDWARAYTREVRQNQLKAL